MKEIPKPLEQTIDQENTIIDLNLNTNTALDLPNDENPTEDLSYFSFSQENNILYLSFLKYDFDLTMLDEFHEILSVADLDDSIDILVLKWVEERYTNHDQMHHEMLSNLNQSSHNNTNNSNNNNNNNHTNNSDHDFIHELINQHLTDNLEDIALDSLAENIKTSSKNKAAIEFKWSDVFLKNQLKQYDRYFQQKHQFYGKYLNALESFSKITIMQIDATLNDVATEIALIGDLIIASDRSQIKWQQQGPIQIPFFKGRLSDLNQPRALELCLLNKSLQAFEALHWGVVDQVENSDQLNLMVANIAKKLAQHKTNLLKFYKNFKIHKTQAHLFFNQLFNEEAL
jgi:hypothetical protein